VIWGDYGIIVIKKKEIEFFIIKVILIISPNRGLDERDKSLNRIGGKVVGLSFTPRMNSGDVPTN